MARFSRNEEKNEGEIKMRMLWVYDGGWQNVKFAVPWVAPPAGYLVIMEAGDGEVFVYADRDPAAHIECWMKQARHLSGQNVQNGRVAIALVERDVEEMLRDVLFLLAPLRIYPDGFYYCADVDHVRSVVMDALQYKEMRLANAYFNGGGQCDFCVPSAFVRR